MNSVASLILGIAVLGLVIYRQVTPRQVADSLRLPLVLGVVGLIEMWSYLNAHHGSAVLVAELAGSLVLAAAFGVIRAMTVRLSWRQGQWWSQGSWFTAGLWILSLAVHLGYDAVLGHGATGGAFGGVTVLLYLAVTFTSQRLAVQARARRMPAAVPAPG